MANETTMPMHSPVTKSYAQTTSGALTLSDESRTTKTLIRAGAGTPARGSLAVAYGSSSSVAGLITAGTRPDEWLLIGDTDAVNDRVAGLDTTGHVSLVDWTHGRAMFRLSGTPAALALSKVCSMDFSEAMTPNGAVVSASVAKAGCDIIRQDNVGANGEEQPSYLLLCDRSFGQYLFDALIDTCDEFGVNVEA